MIESLYQYLISHAMLLSWLALFSLAIFVLGIIATPFIIVAIPDDYFDKNQRPSRNTRLPIVVTIVLKILKNMLGIVLVVGGMAMLLLPGQGILTLFLGLLLLDYPGKYHFEKKLIARPKILKLINWIRRKRNRKEFVL